MSNCKHIGKTSLTVEHRNPLEAFLKKIVRDIIYTHYHARHSIDINQINDVGTFQHLFLLTPQARRQQKKMTRQAHIQHTGPHIITTSFRRYIYIWSRPSSIPRRFYKILYIDATTFARRARIAILGICTWRVVSGAKKLHFRRRHRLNRWLWGVQRDSNYTLKKTSAPANAGNPMFEEITA